MTRPPIRGLLFDKDGTLFDFVQSWAAVIDATLEVLEPEPARQDTMAMDAGYDRANRRFLPGAPCVAGAVAEVAALWAGHLPHMHADEIEAIANEVAEAEVAAGALCPAVPDLAGFLHGLKASGYVLGIATHDTERAARIQMETVGALDHFDFVAGYDSGHGLKPGPGMLLAFAAATSLHPREIAMIGDSVHDLGVAPAAGAALAVGVLTGPADHADLAPHADHVLDSIADLPALLAARL